MLFVDQKFLAKGLLCIIVVLVAASLVGDIFDYAFGHDYIFGIRPLFQLGNERNIPTWYAVCSLITASILLLIIARLESKRHDPNKIYWLVLSAIFLFLAYDEGFSVHEKLSRVGARLFGNDGFLHFAWVAPASILILVGVVFFMRFLISLEKDIRNRFLVSGSIYIGGAVVFEAISGKYLSINEEDFGYALIDTVEESLEMIGIYLFILALLKYLELNFKSVTFTFSEHSPGREANSKNRLPQE